MPPISSGTTHSRSARRRLWAGVCLSIGAALTAVGAGITFGLHETSSGGWLTTDELVPARLAARGERIPRLVNCRTDPLRVLPNPGLAELVDEDDLIDVLCGALPWWSPPSVPSAFHELKLWGRRAVFTKEMFGLNRTGESLLTALLSDSECRARTAQVGGSYLLDSPYGIRVVQYGTPDAIEYRAEAHYGQLLMILGEVGVASTTTATTSSGRTGTVADIYQDALMRFSYSKELEFITCALAYWHPPGTRWQDQFGAKHSFDELLPHLLSTQLKKATCGGCHVPYGVITLLRVAELLPILSDERREEAREWIAAVSRRLEDHPCITGGWDKHWHEDANGQFVFGDELLDRITVTGHHLEWIALAPADLRPSRESIRRAVKALRRDVDSLPVVPHRPFKALLPVSHAARALALMRGDDPFTVWVRYWKSGRLRKGEYGLELRTAVR